MVSDLRPILYTSTTFSRSLRIWAKSDGIYSGRHENDFAPNAVAEGFDTLTVIKKHNIELLKKTQEVTIRVHLR